jgi:thiosulfate dehydrogenase [quinone] large subunit
MILLGILTWPALVAGALLIAVLTFGSCLIQDWNAAGVQLLYAVVYALLLASCRYNTISVDALLVRRRPNQPIPRA